MWTKLAHNIIYVHYSDNLQLITSKESACRIICTRTPENGGIAEHFPLCSFKKGGNGGRNCLFITGVGAGTFLGVRFFARISPNLPEKWFVQLLPAIVLPQRSWRPFFGVTSKKGLHVVFANLGRHFLKSSNVGCHFHPDFQGFCPDLEQIKPFGGALASPPPTPLLFITML